MGFFDFLKKKHEPEETITVMCHAYNLALEKFVNPKGALKAAYRAVSDRDDRLRYVEAEVFFVDIFSDDYINLSGSSAKAKPFSVRAITNIVTAYLHPEVSSMHQAVNLNVENFGEWGRKEKELTKLVEKILK